MAGELHFDTMSVDVSLAEAYLITSVEEIKKWQDCDEDGAPDFPNTFCGKNIPFDEYSEKLLNLSEEIKKHTNLICQLEYLLRKRPIEVTKMDLQMIVGNLCNHKYTQYIQSPEAKASPACLFMSGDSPLMDLGWVAQMPTMRLLAARDVAVVCHLFTKLCNKCGLDGVHMRFTKASGYGLLDFEQIGSLFVRNKVLDGGCIGVVTAKSDVDSAVAAFLASPKIHHWGIRRILIQESARDRFKSSIAWQTRRQPAPESRTRHLSTDVYVYDDKTFVHEFVGDDLQGAAPIEEFRTVKELISFVESYSPFAVSLWAGDVAEANEISLGVTAPLTWVNRYGVLDDPLVAAAYYTQHNNSLRVPEGRLTQLARVQRDWARLTPRQRFDRVSRYFPEVSDSKVIADGYRHILSGAFHVTENVMRVGAGCTVVGVRVPLDTYVVDWGGVKESPRSLLEFFETLILYGSGFVIESSDKEDVNFSENLAKVGAPLLTSSFREINTFIPKHTVRVIHTSF